MILPGAQELFEKYFLPWHDGEVKPAGPLPETYIIKVIAGQPLNQRLRPDYAGLLQDYLLETLPGAARHAYQPLICFNHFDETVLEAVDAYYDAKKIAALIERSSPDDFANDYLTAAGHFAVMLSSLFLQREGFGWLYQHPYFHSVMVHRNSGTAIPVFDWALKRLSNDGVAGSIVTQYRRVAEIKLSTR